MRIYRRLHLRLSKGDREKLDDILMGGVQAVRTVLRALVLCRLDEGRVNLNKRHKSLIGFSANRCRARAFAIFKLPNFNPA